jgi:hypothetical protein
MSNIMFLYNNLIDSATLTASSAATGYPASNLKNQLRSKTWMTAGGVAGTANLVIDHGAAKAVTCVALTGYDWLSQPGTLDLEFDEHDAWGAPDDHVHLTWAASPTTNGNKATIILTFASKSYRYNRLNVVYSPGGVPTDWNLGRIYVGEYFQPTDNYLWEHQQELIDPSFMSQTIGGQRYIDEIEKYRRVGVDFFFNGQAQWELFQKMYNSVGVSRDLFIAFDYDNEPDEMTIYGKFASSLPAGVNRNVAFKLDFEESR